MNPELSPRGSHPIGLILIHGTGKQRPGETADKLVDGLLHVYGEQLFVTRDEANLPTRLALGEQVVRLYEVSCADLLSGDRVTGTFGWNQLHTLAWFPLLNWKAGLLFRPLYMKRQVVMWSLLLIPMTLLLYVVYLSARWLAQMTNAMWHRGSVPRVPAGDVAWWKRLWTTARTYAKEGRQRRTAVENLLDTHVGDVVNYIGSVASVGAAARHNLGRVAHDVQTRFYDALGRALNDGCETLQILTHGLGTVVAYHGLTGLLLERGRSALPSDLVLDPLARLTHLYTIGSPLEKIRFFFPWTIRDRVMRLLTFLENHPYEVEQPSTSPPQFHWDNFYYEWDIVSGPLVRFDHWGLVRNHALEGGGGWIRSRLVYQQSREFLATMTEGLFGTAISVDQSNRQHAKELVLSSLENLAIPIGLGVLLLMGAGLSLVGLLLPGFIASLPFRLLGASKLVWWIHDVMAVLMIVAIIKVGIFGAKRKAEELHALWTSRWR